ncbi:MAG: hypothetical protein HY909_27840 [Deltaproteobacteria bacterium]|nr:hypothetical protein [Deltaproteobacteria bacterium]
MRPDRSPPTEGYFPILVDAIARDFLALLQEANRHPRLQLDLGPQALPPGAPPRAELCRPKAQAVGTVTAPRCYAPGAPELLQVRYHGVKTLVRDGQDIRPAVRDLTFSLHFGPRYPLELGFSCSEALAHPNTLAGLTCPDYRPGIPLLALLRRLYRMAIFEVLTPEKSYPLQERVLAWLRAHPDATPTQENHFDAAPARDPSARRILFHRREAP